MPDRSASNSLGLRGASAVAPALEKVTIELIVVAAFVYAYTIAGVVMYEKNAYPLHNCRSSASRRHVPQRTPTLHGSDPCMDIYATNVEGDQTTFSRRLIK